MNFVTIPFDYHELPATAQAEVIPICIARNDEQGRPIAWEWFEAVARIPNRLLSLATRYLGDVWRASELSEWALHRIWYLHGTEFGRYPEYRVYAHAAWHAKDLQAGTWHERRGIVEALDGLEQVIRQEVLRDRKEYEREYQRKLDYAAISRRLEDQGLAQISLMLDLLCDGRTWDEIGEKLGKTGDAARMQFRRKTKGIFTDWRP